MLGGNGNGMFAGGEPAPPGLGAGNGGRFEGLKPGLNSVSGNVERVVRRMRWDWTYGKP